MKKLVQVAAVAAFGLMVATGAEAACINKAGQGTNSTEDGAKFQAWEAVLQATSWGSWASFMSSGQKIGTAPGYQVKNVRTKCVKGGIGTECVMQATLCN
jgi:hypothetical protein